MSQIQTAGFNTLGAIDQWMKTIAGNLSGSAVTGYRGTDMQFGEVLTQQLQGATQATGANGSQNPIQRSDSGIAVTGTSTNFTQGSITQTGNPTDLAISGTGTAGADAFFTLSGVPNPSSMADLSFTRDGSFHFEFLPGPQTGTGSYRLVNKDGLFVMGYNSPVDPINRPAGTPPQESQGTGLSAFNTTIANGAGGGLGVSLQNIQLDMVRNPDAANNVTFDSHGMLQVDGTTPFDINGNAANIQVGLARFANAQGLNREGGGAYFNYNSVAGEIFTGTANNSGLGNVVGSNTVLTPGAIEQANTSINTILPEITLAQKSFTAATKIVWVGNAMIDDVNGLIR
jgi:flagellar hook protein FlgE